jgi:hypothetical protein
MYSERKWVAVRALSHRLWPSTRKESGTQVTCPGPGMHFQGVGRKQVEMRLSRCAWGACVRLGLVIGSVLAIMVPCGDSVAAKKGDAPHVWWAPDSSWAVGGFGKLRPGLAEEIIAKKPAELDGMKGFELELKEPGEWLGFGVLLKRVEKVVFTKNTKIVLVDKEGKRIESEAIVFWPDYLQTSLYDSRKMPVVVTKTSVWCEAKNGYPCGVVKFPAGSIELKNIAGFEVVGAVEDRGGGEVK